MYSVKSLWHVGVWNTSSVDNSMEYDKDKSRSGFLPFFRNKFEGLFQDSDRFLQDSTFHLKPFHSQDFKFDSPYSLLTFLISEILKTLLLELSRFQELQASSRTFQSRTTFGSRLPEYVIYRENSSSPCLKLGFFRNKTEAGVILFPLTLMENPHRSRFPTVNQALAKLLR